MTAEVRKSASSSSCKPGSRHFICVPNNCCTKTSPDDKTRKMKVTWEWSLNTEFVNRVLYNCWFSLDDDLLGKTPFNFHKMLAASDITQEKVHLKFEKYILLCTRINSTRLLLINCGWLHHIFNYFKMHHFVNKFICKQIFIARLYVFVNAVDSDFIIFALKLLWA